MQHDLKLTEHGSCYPDNQDSLRRARSFLFVPANRPDRIVKAINTEADVVIVDLEDAVGVAAKDNARRMLLAWLDEHPTHRLAVRINARSTPWFTDDLDACRHPQISAIVLPKAEQAETLAHVHDTSNKPVLPIIESAQGMQSLASIAAAPGVTRLLFGKLDLALQLQLNPDESDPHELVFLAFRAQLVLASALAKLPPPVDGVYTDINNDAGWQAYVRRAKNAGFGALLLIHPRQMSAVHTLFTPSVAELTWAKNVVALVAAADGDVLQLNGQMIDAPVLARAQQILNST